MRNVGIELSRKMFLRTKEILERAGERERERERGKERQG